MPNIATINGVTEDNVAAYNGITAANVASKCGDTWAHGGGDGWNYLVVAGAGGGGGNIGDAANVCAV